MSIPTLTNKITTEDGEQDGFHTVHFLYYKRLSKPYGQLKRGWEVRVLKGRIIQGQRLYYFYFFRKQVIELFLDFVSFEDLQIRPEGIKWCQTTKW